MLTYLKSFFLLDGGERVRLDTDIAVIITFQYLRVCNGKGKHAISSSVVPGFALVELDELGINTTLLVVVFEMKNHVALGIKFASLLVEYPFLGKLRKD